ncbi:hypothetical protein ACVIGB_000152 [Bradyrhizobium sp. USDA 4341]
MFDKAASFLEAIGISVRIEQGARGFLNQLRIEGSGLVVENNDSEIVGDMLHEAGHIAVIPSLFRGQLTADVDDVAPIMAQYVKDNPNCMAWPEDPIARAIMQSGEQEAIAWSYAAAHHIGIDTRLPFAQGFDGNGQEIHDMLAIGCHLGIHGLFHAGMTQLPRQVHGYPKMKRWMQI